MPRLRHSKAGGTPALSQDRQGQPRAEDSIRLSELYWGLSPPWPRRCLHMGFRWVFIFSSPGEPTGRATRHASHPRAAPGTNPSPLPSRRSDCVNLRPRPEAPASCPHLSTAQTAGGTPQLPGNALTSRIQQAPVHGRTAYQACVARLQSSLPSNVLPLIPLPRCGRYGSRRCA